MIHFALRPIPELANLRQSELVNLSEVTVDEANGSLSKIQGDTLEIELIVSLDEVSQIGLNVRQAPDESEVTQLYFNEGLLGIDRTQSTLSPDVFEKNSHEGPVDLVDGKLHLHIFLDRSMIEMYANSRKSITSRVYPTLPESVGLSLFGDSDVQIDSLKVWQLGSAFGDGSIVPAYHPDAVEIVATGELPNHSFQSCDLTGWEIVRGSAFQPEHIVEGLTGGSLYPALDGLGPCYFNGVSERHLGDLATGTMRSQPFVLAGDGQIDFLIGGGQNEEALYVALLPANDLEAVPLLKATGPQTEQFVRVRWDASQWIGQELVLEFVDRTKEGLGHLNIDDVNVPTAGEPDMVPSAVMEPEAEPAVLTESADDAEAEVVESEPDNQDENEVSETIVPTPIPDEDEEAVVEEAERPFPTVAVLGVGIVAALSGLAYLMSRRTRS